jgi:uncharacterized protein
MSALSCPVCQGTMREISKEGVLIDTCTQCRGVWLDRGELEKLIGLVEQPVAAQRAALTPQRDERQADPYRERRRDWDGDDDDTEDSRYSSREGGVQKRSKMSRLMDFFD